LTNYLLSLKLPLIIEELKFFLLFCDSHDAGDAGLQVIYYFGLCEHWVLGKDLFEKKLMDRLCFFRVRIEGEQIQEFFKDSQVNELTIKLEEDDLTQSPNDVICTLYFIFICAAIWLT
jgi:hypothetical protein